MSHDAQAEGARKSNTPWRGDNRMLIGSQRTVRDNARAQSQALKRMSLLERETGHDEEWWDNFAVIDTELQRVATAYQESDSAPVRESLARRAKKLSGLIDRLIGWRS